MSGRKTAARRLSVWLAGLPWSLAFIAAGASALLIFVLTGSSIMSLPERPGAAGIYFIMGCALYGGLIAVGRYALRR